MKLANLAGRPVVVNDGRPSTSRPPARARSSRTSSVLSDLSLHDELRNLADSADEADWTPFDRRDLGRVSRPYKAIGVALNYRGHAEESNLPVPDEPSVFAKFASSVVGPYDPIVVPPEYDKVDYEAEVVVVMGARRQEHQRARRLVLRRGRHRRSGHQRPQRAVAQAINQFTLPKSYDTFSPIGPYLVTLDEFEDLDDIEVAGQVDDLEVQRGRTSDLIFSVPELIAWLSKRVTFEPAT